MNKVYVGKIPESGLTSSILHQALEWLGWEAIIPAGARIFIKPNLTWPEHLPGVTTTPAAMESLVSVLRTRSSNITIGESDGGYHSYRAEEAFTGHKLYALVKKYGISLTNLSAGKSETRTLEVAGKPVEVTLPAFLLHEIDVFITMPVPKTHVMTTVSLAFKNQWGCIPSTMRLREHYQFDRKIIAINRLLKPRLAVLDGTYFLDGAGPMTGEAVRMDQLIVGDDIGAASLVACKIMGINPASVRHIKAAMAEDRFPPSLDSVQLNTPLDPFLGSRFRMKRAFLDWISLIGFRSRFFTYLFWESPLANPLHDILYRVRANPVIERLLYGEPGTPPSWRSPAGRSGESS
jgi:uncharacterized protein (DUF362 family)